MGLLSTLKQKVIATKEQLFPQTEFDEATLPWIDRPGANVDEFIKNYKPKFDVTYNLAEKLKFWQQNGYVILEQSIQSELLDMFWSDVEELVEHPTKYKMWARIDLPKFDPTRERHIKDFPKEDLKGKYVKLNDFHNLSVAGKKLMTHPAIATFLDAIFQQNTVVMQSLTFMYGSQQPTHQDYPWVTAKIASHLAAAWIPLEDIKIDSGPLYYYIGSHKMPKFNFGNGILYNNRSTKTALEFADYLDTKCTELKLPKDTLLIKRGDVLIWHAALAHGGGLITNPDQTRKSYVCHYSTEEALPYHRHRFGQIPDTEHHNDIAIYKNPDFTEQENILKGGEKWDSK
jgi:phytanoyl-CoA hydroxylase